LSGDVNAILSDLDASLRGSAPEGQGLTALLLGARDALTGLQRELDEARNEADRVAKAASHDLRAPARHLVLFLDLALNQIGDETPAEAREFLGHARAAADKLAQLLDRLQVWSRAGRTPLSNEPIDLAQRLEVCLQDLRQDHAQVAITVQAADLPTVYGTRSLMDQVLRELVGNAVMYRNGDAVTLTLTCVQEGDDWWLTVQDDGMGIAPERLERVGEPFTRLHAWDQIPGAGLGLPIAERVVQRHGGDLALSSEEGVGTTVRVRWPV